MSHHAGVSITKLRFDKSPNIIMVGERNRPTQLETTVEFKKLPHKIIPYYLDIGFIFPKQKFGVVSSKINVISKRKIL